jgi:hypothetical protein
MRGGIYTPENSVDTLSIGDLNNSNDSVPFELEENIEGIPHDEEDVHYFDEDDDDDLNQSSVYGHSFGDSMDDRNNTTFESQGTNGSITNGSITNGSMTNSLNTTEGEVSFGGKRRRKRRRTNKRKTRKTKKTRKNKKRRQRGGIIL